MAAQRDRRRLVSQDSSRGHLLLRADANGGTGGIGHVMRCLGLAQAWQARGGKATFVSNCEGDILPRRVESSGVGFIPLPRANQDPADLFAVIGSLSGNGRGPGDPWIVLDGYHFGPEYQRAIRQAGYRLLVIDDNAHQPEYHADILLNPCIHAGQLSYRCDPDTMLLLGTRYLLLRPEFLSWREWHRDIPDGARRVLVTMGGADPNNVTMKVLRALDHVRVPGFQAKVLVGPANRYVDIVRQAAQRSAQDVEVLTPEGDMPGLMAWADVGVSASGITAWETAFMGLPTILITLADNQELIGAELHRQGLAACLGWWEQVDEEMIAGLLVRLLEDPGLRRDMSRQSRVLVDGLGTDRVAAILEGSFVQGAYR